MTQPRQILVIDDNRDIGEVVRATAESVKMRCEISTTVDGFLAALTAETHLIVMDMKMPEMNGRELLALLAAHQCASGIVLMSGMGDRVLKAAETYGRGLGLKMAGTLPKPFRVAELLAVLRR
jgi:CheY-like chemotaxis protein